MRYDDFNVNLPWHYSQCMALYVQAGKAIASHANTGNVYNPLSNQVEAVGSERNKDKMICFETNDDIYQYFQHDIIQIKSSRRS